MICWKRSALNQRSHHLFKYLRLQYINIRIEIFSHIRFPRQTFLYHQSPLPPQRSMTSYSSHRILEEESWSAISHRQPDNLSSTPKQSVIEVSQRSNLTFPDVSFGVRDDASELDIDEAYHTTLSWLLNQFSQKGGNASLIHLLNQLGNPHHHLRIIHVAGTNGKGSVSEKIMGALQSASVCQNLAHTLHQNSTRDSVTSLSSDSKPTSSRIHVGLFTSPHIASIRERFRIDGHLITKSDFVRLFHRIAVVAGNPERQFCQPISFFEILTAMMFIYFCEGPNVHSRCRLYSDHLTSPMRRTDRATHSPLASLEPSHGYNKDDSTADGRSRFTSRKFPYCDFAVVEVGLGGRLDATNVIQSQSVLCSVITSIGWDHMDILGSSLEDIAREKAGIFKPKRPVVLGPQATQFESIDTRSSELQCHPIVKVPIWRGNQRESFDSENERIAT